MRQTNAAGSALFGYGRCCCLIGKSNIALQVCLYCAVFLRVTANKLINKINYPKFTAKPHPLQEKLYTIFKVIVKFI